MNDPDSQDLGMPDPAELGVLRGTAVEPRPGLPFPDAPGYSGFTRPTRVEADIFDLEIVQGAFPPELSGRFYSIAPETQFAPKIGFDLPFNGDGMVRMFTIANGHVDYRSRYVMTPKLEAERKARRALFGLYRNPFTDDPSVIGIPRGNANTAMVYHGGKFLALKEDALPMALDPLTLETLGYWDFDKALTSLTFTAHPKIDAATGEMFSFGYEAAGLLSKDVCYSVTDRNGRITHQVWFEAPFVSSMHDFVVSDDFAIFTVFPATADFERLRSGGHHWRWDPQLPTYIGIMPRYGNADQLRWITMPPRFSFHYFNASNEGSRIIVEGCISEAICTPFFYPDTRGELMKPGVSMERLTRWSFDYDKPEAGVEETVLNDEFTEFPTIDPRWETHRQRYGFALVASFGPGEEFDPERASFLGLNALIRYDFIEDREADRYTLDSTSTFQEPRFIPRGANAAEGDGWILVVANRAATMLNDLLLFDAKNLAAGPIATAALPIRIHYGIHTTWIDGALL